MDRLTARGWSNPFRLRAVVLPCSQSVCPIPHCSSSSSASTSDLHLSLLLPMAASPLHSRNPFHQLCSSSASRRKEPELVRCRFVAFCELVDWEGKEDLIGTEMLSRVCVVKDGVCSCEIVAFGNLIV